MSHPKFILALDVEASGMGLRSNFLVQMGLALISVELGEVVRRFSSYVRQPAGTTWEPRCVDEFWAKHPEAWERAKLALLTAPEESVVRERLLEWLAGMPAGTRLVTDTPGYDVAWLDYLLYDRSHMYLFTGKESGKPEYNDVLDASSWCIGLAWKSDPDLSWKKCALRVAGDHDMTALPVFPGVEHDHDAANDAAHTGLLVAWVMRQQETKHAANAYPLEFKE